MTLVEDAKMQKTSTIEMAEVDVDFPTSKRHSLGEPEVVVNLHGDGHDDVGQHVVENTGAAKLDGKEHEDATTAKGAWGGLMDHNVYATKKTVAQGLLDVALLTANASQLKYLLQVGTQHEFYHLMLVLISLSIALQIIVGFMFLVLGTLDVNLEKHQHAADILNNTATAAVFIVTVLNIIIASFGMHHTDTLVYSKIL